MLAGEQAAAHAAALQDAAPPSGDGKKQRIVLWKQGFTVNDGSLRRYDDPANAGDVPGCARSVARSGTLTPASRPEFMRDIEAGYAPRELGIGGGSMGVDVDDRRQEEYQLRAAHHRWLAAARR